MASTRFTVLTGHLSQYSLADLIGILRHQRKTGRLLIEYAGSPAILFFKDGDLVDAQYNTLVGVQAIFVSFVQPPAAFNFNPLIQPTRFSIDSEQQRVILELLGCWTEDLIVVSSTPGPVVASTSEPLRPELQGIDAQNLIPASSLDSPMVLKEADEMLALPAGPPPRSIPRYSSRRPFVLAVATFVLLLVFGVPTLIAINNKVRRPAQGSAAPAPSDVLNEQAAPVSDTGNSSQATVKTGPAQSVTLPEQRRDLEQVSNEPRLEKPQQDVVTTAAPLKEAAQSPAVSDQSVQSEKSKQPATAGQTVKVVMRIENGRVVHATVGDRRPGAEAYESLALRIARQRRYPAGVNKQETLIMKVDGPK